MNKKCNGELIDLIAFLQSTYMILLTKTYFFHELSVAFLDISLNRFSFSIYQGIYQGVINKYLQKKHVFDNNIIYVDFKNAIRSLGSCFLQRIYIHRYI